MKNKLNAQALRHHEIITGTTRTGMGIGPVGFLLHVLERTGKEKCVIYASDTQLKDLSPDFSRAIADNCTVKIELKQGEPGND